MVRYRARRGASSFLSFVFSEKRRQKEALQAPSVYISAGRARGVFSVRPRRRIDNRDNVVVVFRLVVVGSGPPRPGRRPAELQPRAASPLLW